MEIIPKIHRFSGISNNYLVENDEMMLIDTW